MSILVMIVAWLDVRGTAHCSVEIRRFPVPATVTATTAATGVSEWSRPLAFVLLRSVGIRRRTAGKRLVIGRFSPHIPLGLVHSAPTTECGTYGSSRWATSSSVRVTDRAPTALSRCEVLVAPMMGAVTGFF